MKIKFLGATKTVTGSFFVLETENKRFAVDCGLFQGPKEIKERNYRDFVIEPGSIDFLLLTHAHIDHTGLVPKLCKHGFKGPIYCSFATAELSSVMLPDAGYIQEMEVERKNRKFIQAGKEPVEPIYTAEDALECLKQFRPLNMDEVIDLAPGIEIRLRDAGHILGSCIVELWIVEDGKKLKLVFTGDLGNVNQPILKDPTVVENTDYLITESTYGNRSHKNIGDRPQQLKEIIDFTMQKGGNLIIPAFAVERTQDLLYDLNVLYKNGQLDPNIDIYIDSPLAIAATEIFEHNINFYDDETRQMVQSGNHFLKIPNLKFSRSQQDSMRLNQTKGKTIIISASGMCDAGRIKHHLRHNLWRPESTILIVGYQSQGTLGRRLVDGEKIVTVHGEQIAVKADIKTIDAYSAHADREGLLEWMKQFVVPPKAIFIVHGEEEAQIEFAGDIKAQLNIPTFIPAWLDEYTLKPAQELSKTVYSGADMNKAMIAEQMYLDLRLKMNRIFKEYWDKADYDKIIDYINNINAGV
ncbi:MAG TPA: MBL fold metallo-hydrolase [Syntrophomonadaceae bacterium]|nr:MBL fold metallo-hydrolase [Syntrophomonadaceae bacterium]HPR92956.1 MBL fold metallo-hydrolase [Syntrophomonadaceae bacterium]